MSREELGSGAPLGAMPVEPVELLDEVDGQLSSPPTGAVRRLPWPIRGRVPAWGALAAVLLAGGLGVAGGWVGQRTVQARRAADRPDLRLSVAGFSSAGGESVRIDATVLNAGHRPLTVTGARVGPVALSVQQQAPVAPGARQDLVLAARLDRGAGCALGVAGGDLAAMPVLLHVVDAHGRTADVTVQQDPAPVADGSVPPLAAALCPRGDVTPPTVQQAVAVVNKDGSTHVHLVLAAAADALPLEIVQVDGLPSITPVTPVQIAPGGTGTVDGVLPPISCPDASGGGFPSAGLDVAFEQVGRPDQQFTEVDLGPAYVTAVAKVLARCPVPPTPAVG